MKRLIVGIIAIMALSGCQAAGDIDGQLYSDAYSARSGCVADEWKKTNDYLSVSDFKVIKLPDGNWKCERVFGKELEKQKANAGDERLAYLDGVSLEQYRKDKADRKEKIKNAYIELYKDKETQYAEQKKDGELHVDVYTQPDGSVRGTSIQGNNRCDTYSDENGASINCY